MAKYRKRPVVIEATQWFEYGDHPDVTKHSHSDGYQPGDWWPGIQTLEGVLHVTPGDWIITGVAGEKYPCKPDIFAVTYEAVE